MERGIVGSVNLLVNKHKAQGRKDNDDDDDDDEDESDENDDERMTAE